MSLILLLLVLLGAMLYLGVPVALSLFLSATVILFTLDIPLVVAVQRMAAGVNVFTLLAIPLFILAGELMTQAGIARRTRQAVGSGSWAPLRAVWDKSRSYLPCCLGLCRDRHWRAHLRWDRRLGQKCGSAAMTPTTP